MLKKFALALILGMLTGLYCPPALAQNIASTTTLQETYQTQYSAAPSGNRSPTLTVNANQEVFLNGTPINKPSWSDNQLVWSIDDGNSSEATLTFTLPTPQKPKTTPSFKGTLTFASNAPGFSNASGNFSGQLANTLMTPMTLSTAGEGLGVCQYIPISSSSYEYTWNCDSNFADYGGDDNTAIAYIGSLGQFAVASKSNDLWLCNYSLIAATPDSTGTGNPNVNCPSNVATFGNYVENLAYDLYSNLLYTLTQASHLDVCAVNSSSSWNCSTLLTSVQGLTTPPTNPLASPTGPLPILIWDDQSLNFCQATSAPNYQSQPLAQDGVTRYANYASADASITPTLGCAQVYYASLGAATTQQNSLSDPAGVSTPIYSNSAANPFPANISQVVFGNFQLRPPNQSIAPAIYIALENGSLYACPAPSVPGAVLPYIPSGQGVAPAWAGDSGNQECYSIATLPNNSGPGAMTFNFTDLAMAYQTFGAPNSWTGTTPKYAQLQQERQTATQKYQSESSAQRQTQQTKAKEWLETNESLAQRQTQQTKAKEWLETNESLARLRTQRSQAKKWLKTNVKTLTYPAGNLLVSQGSTLYVYDPAYNNPANPYGQVSVLELPLTDGATLQEIVADPNGNVLIQFGETGLIGANAPYLPSQFYLILPNKPSSPSFGQKVGAFFKGFGDKICFDFKAAAHGEIYSGPGAQAMFPQFQCGNHYWGYSKKNDPDYQAPDSY